MAPLKHPSSTLDGLGGASSRVCALGRGGVEWGGGCGTFMGLTLGLVSGCMPFKPASRIVYQLPDVPPSLNRQASKRTRE